MSKPWEALTAFRGVAIPTLARADDAVWGWIRSRGIAPGQPVGHAAFDTSVALRAAESAARSFPIDPSGL